MNTKNTSDSTHKTGILTSNDVMPCCQSTSNGTIRTQFGKIGLQWYIRTFK